MLLWIQTVGYTVWTKRFFSIAIFMLLYYLHFRNSLMYCHRVFTNAIAVVPTSISGAYFFFVGALNVVPIAMLLYHVSLLFPPIIPLFPPPNRDYTE